MVKMNEHKRRKSDDSKFQKLSDALKKNLPRRKNIEKVRKEDNNKNENN